MDKIFTKRLTLRKLEEADIKIFSEWSNNSEAYGKYLAMEKYTYIECMEKFKCNFFWNEKNKTYLIELKNNKPIGTIHYWTKVDKKVTVIIALKISYKELRGNGYGTEAQKALIKNLFNNYKVDQIEMYTDLDNKPQQRCLEKLGFYFIESLDYDDQNIKRIGNLYRLTKDTYISSTIYLYEYA